MAAILSLKSGQCSSDTIEHALDVHIDHPFPFLDFIGGSDSTCCRSEIEHRFLSIQQLR